MLLHAILGTDVPLKREVLVHSFYAEKQFLFRSCCSLSQVETHLSLSQVICTVRSTSRVCTV